MRVSLLASTVPAAHFHPVLLRRLSLTALAVVVPFWLWHALAGRWLETIIIGALLVTLALLGWRKTRAVMVSPRIALALIGMGNGLLVGVILCLGAAGTVWAYPLLLFNYFVLPLRWASGLNAAVILAVAGAALFEVISIQGLRLLASLFATAVFARLFAAHIADQTRNLVRLADYDPLTQAGNRRLMAAQLSDALATHRRSQVPMALVMLDIDHFKTINDTHGHTHGDRVLVALAETLRERSRQTDQLFRVGGEEFVLLLPHTEGNGAVRLTEAIRQQVESLSLGDLAEVTFSAGVAVAQATDTPETWLQRADRALYEAKAQGRNRVRWAETRENGSKACLALG